MDVTYAVCLVLISALMHAFWNIIVKKSLHKDSFLWSTQVISTIIFMPFFLNDLFKLDLSLWNVLLIIFSFAFQCIYLYLLSKAYSLGDMSQAYPLMRGSAALLIPVVSMIIYKDFITGLGWLGLFLIVIGLLLISEIFIKTPDKKNILMISVTGGVGLTITGYTIIDKAIVVFMSPPALLQIYNLAGVVSLAVPAIRSKKIKQEWKANKWLILICVILGPGSYLIFLWAMKMASLSYIAPIREISIVFGAFLSWLILKEGKGTRRLRLSLVVFLGICILGLYGHTN